MSSTIRETPQDNERALQIIKVKGPQPLTVLAKEMGITTEGARFHLLRLAGEGLVKSASVVKGRGRPQQIWSLTEAGNARFPDAHANMTVRLIEKIRTLFGEAGMKAVIDAGAAETRQKYRSALKGLSTLEAKVKALAQLRNAEGYMARVEKQGDAYLLIEDHCPICSAATACQGFCSAELDTFREVLGPGIQLQRIDHVLSGGQRCTYTVSPRK